MALKSGRKYSEVCKPRLARAAALASLGISLIQVDGMHIATKKIREATITSEGESALEFGPPSVGAKILYVGGAVNEDRGTTSCGTKQYFEDYAYIFVVGRYPAPGYGPCVIQLLKEKGAKLLVATDPNMGDGDRGFKGGPTMDVESWEAAAREAGIAAESIETVDTGGAVTEVDSKPLKGKELHLAVVQHVLEEHYKTFIGMLVFNGGPTMRFEAEEFRAKNKVGKVIMLDGQGVPLPDKVLYVGGAVNENRGKTMCGKGIEKIATFKPQIIFVVGDYAKKGYGLCVIEYLEHHKDVKLLVANDPNPLILAGEEPPEPWSDVVKAPNYSNKIIRIAVDVAVVRDQKDPKEKHFALVKHVFKTEFAVDLQYHMLVFNGGPTTLFEAEKDLFKGEHTMLSAAGTPLSSYNVLYVGGTIKHKGDCGLHIANSKEHFKGFSKQPSGGPDYIFVVGAYVKGSYGDCVIKYLADGLTNTNLKLVVAEDPNKMNCLPDDTDVQDAAAKIVADAMYASQSDYESWTRELSKLGKDKEDRVIPLFVDSQLKDIPLSRSIDEAGFAKEAKNKKGCMQKHWNLVSHVFTKIFDSHYHLLSFAGGPTMQLEAQQPLFSGKATEVPAPAKGV